MIPHFPTLFLIIGYIAFWLELYLCHYSGGHTSPLAVVASLLVGGWLLFKERFWLASRLKRLKKDWAGLPKTQRIYFFVASLGVCAILGVSLYASYFPPHLMPEMDVINYHYTIPRQHLIRHSFTHIPWSAADLWPFPLQFALAPYWFVTDLPNKIPQMLFSVGLLAIIFSMAYRCCVEDSKKLTAGFMVLFAMAGSHGFGIQYGSAMLDIAMCYLFIAFIDSLMSRRFLLASIELSFFVWAKAFYPIQVIGIAVIVAYLIWVARRYSWKFSLMSDGVPLPALSDVKKTIIWFALASMFVGVPFCLKSYYYSGTPLYPFGVGVMSPISDTTKGYKDMLKENAISQKRTRNSYGLGRSCLAFIKHFWYLAVPTRGVNNEYDYPLGLPYLICLIPFLLHTGRCISNKYFPLIPILVVLFWASWWAGSQQSRWLYVPLALMFISVVNQESVLSSWGFKSALFLSLVLTALSVWRGNRGDFGKTAWEVLRPDDKRLIDLKPSDLATPVLLESKEAAFAPFAVEVKRPDSCWILEYK